MKKLLACIALGCIATANSYAGTPLWMRDVQISRMGRKSFFCYKGDIYKGSRQRRHCHPTHHTEFLRMYTYMVARWKRDSFRQ